MSSRCTAVQQRRHLEVAVGVSVSGGRPVRAGHRRVRVQPAGLEGCAYVLQRPRTTTGVTPAEVITGRAPTYPRVLDGMWPAAWHHTEQYANNRIEADHAQLKRRLRAMRGIKTRTGLRIVAAGHAFVQNPAPRTLQDRHR
jgi:DDE domain